MPEDGAWPSGGGGDLVKVVEREVEEVRLEWEESRAAVCRHQTTITDMTVKLVSMHLFKAHHTQNLNMHMYRNNFRQRFQLMKNRSQNWKNWFQRPS